MALKNYLEVKNCFLSSNDLCNSSTRQNLAIKIKNIQCIQRDQLTELNKR